MDSLTRTAFVVATIAIVAAFVPIIPSLIPATAVPNMSVGEPIQQQENFEQVAAPGTDASATSATSTTSETATATAATDQFSNPNTRKPFGGNTTPSQEEADQLIIMAVAGDPGAPFRLALPATGAGLQSALEHLHDNGNPSTTYIIHIGADITGVPTDCFVNSGTRGSFSGLAGRVAGIVLTGSIAADDPITDSAVNTAPTAMTRQLTIASAGTAQSWFGSHVEVRNLRHNLGTNVYMNGYHLTLGGGSWQLTTTSYFGGSNTGVVTPPTGSTSITVYSTGSSNSTFVGGMQTGTINGDTSITINDTSNGGTVTVRGGGVGTANTDAGRADVAGNVTTTIAGLATGSGGLGSYVGGAVFGNIGGSVTNHISGPGRFSTLAEETAGQVNTPGTSANFFTGGSRTGSIGHPAPAAAPAAPSKTNTDDLHQDWRPLLDIPSDQYAIFNYVDTKHYSSGRKIYVGANGVAGDINGDIINIVRAGAHSSGSYAAMYMIGGWQTTIGGNWSNGFSTNPANGVVTVGTGVTSARDTANFRVFGNTISVVREGSISRSIGAQYGWFRASGVGGYIQGDVYAALGTEGPTYTRDRIGWVSNASATSALATGFDIAGGGARLSSPNDILNLGDIRLVMAHTYARWTYGGGFYGVIIGNTQAELHRGAVDTLEGAGYRNNIQIGDARAEVHGGRVNWFLTGGGWQIAWLHGNVSVAVYDNEPAPLINASVGGMYGTSGNTVSGNSDVLITGGHFGRTPRTGPNGISPGPTYWGTIFGNATMTIDLRGNKGGFSTSLENPVSAGRAFGRTHAICARTILGTDESNVNTLNIFADAESDHLSGLTLFGDAIYSGSATREARIGNTRAGRVEININAPGAKLGTVRLANYGNVFEGLMRRDVEVNLVSAASLQGLEVSPGLTNAIVEASAAAARPRTAVVNVGPQSDDPRHVLGERESDWEGEASSPLMGIVETPYQINVAGTGSAGGIQGFTEMNITRRMLNVAAIPATAAGGAINHAGSAAVPDLGTEGAQHGNYGTITLQAGKGTSAAGLGISGNVAANSANSNRAITSGSLATEGEGRVYIQSPGVENQAVFRSLDIGDNASVKWLRVGSASSSALDPVTTWFGTGDGWHVLSTTVEDESLKLTPLNLEGIELSTGRTFIGDNFQLAAAEGQTAEGRVVAIPASLYRWNITSDCEGVVSHNVPVTLQSSIAGLQRPPAGHLYAIGNQAPYPNVSRSGRIVVPSVYVPSPITWPEFTFRSAADFDGLGAGVNEWIHGVQIRRTDGSLTIPPNLNCTIKDADDLRDYAQNHFNEDEPRNFTWLAADSARTANPDRSNDHFFGFSMTSQFESELVASLMISKEILGEFADLSGLSTFRVWILDAQGNPVARQPASHDSDIAEAGLVRPVTTVYTDGITTTARTDLAVTATGYMDIDGFGADIVSLTIHGLPSLWQVRAMQLDPPEDYKVAFVDSANPEQRVVAADTGLVTLGEESRSFEFTNSLNYVPTGLTVSEPAFLWPLLIVSILTSSLVIIKTYKTMIE